MGIFSRGDGGARESSNRPPLTQETLSAVEVNGTHHPHTSDGRQGSVLEITTADNKSAAVDTGQTKGPPGPPGSPMKKAPTVVRLARENGSTEVLFGDAHTPRSQATPKTFVSWKDVTPRHLDERSQSGSERSGRNHKRLKKESLLARLGNEAGQAPNLVLMGDRSNGDNSDRFSTTGSSISGYGLKYVPGKNKAVFAIKGSTMTFLDKSLEAVFGSTQSNDSKPQYRIFLLVTCALMVLLSLVEAGNSASAKPYQIVAWVSMLIGSIVFFIAGVATTFVTMFSKTRGRILLIFSLLIPLISISFFFNWAIDNDKDEMGILDLFCWGGYVWIMLPFRYSFIMPLFSCFVAIIFSLEVLHGHKPPMDNYFFLVGKIFVLNMSGLFGGFLLELALRRSVFAQQALVSRINAVTSYIDIMKAIPNVQIPWSVYCELVRITDEAMEGHGNEGPWENEGESISEAGGTKHVRDWEEIDFPIINFGSLDGVKCLRHIEMVPVVILDFSCPCSPAELTAKQIEGVKSKIEAWHVCLLDIGKKHSVERLSAKGTEYMGMCTLPWPQSAGAVLEFVHEVMNERGVSHDVKVGVGAGSLSIMVLGVTGEVRVLALGNAVDDATAMQKKAEKGTMMVSRSVHSEKAGSPAGNRQGKSLQSDSYVVRFSHVNGNDVAGRGRGQSAPKNSLERESSVLPVRKKEESSLHITWEYAGSRYFFVRCLAFFGLYHDLHPKIDFFNFKKQGLNSVLMMFQKGELRYLKFSIQFFLKNPTVRGLIVLLLIFSGWMMAVVAVHGEGWDSCLNDTKCYVPFVVLVLGIPPFVLISVFLSNVHPFLLMSALALGSATLQMLGLSLLAVLDSDKAKASLIRYNVLWCGIGIFALNIPCPFASFYSAASFIINEVVAWIVVPDYQCANGLITRAVLYGMFALFAFKRDLVLRRMYMMNHILADYETHADMRRDTVLESLNALYTNRVVKVIYERDHPMKGKRTSLSKRTRLEEHDDVSVGVVHFKTSRDLLDAGCVDHMHVLAESIMESAHRSNVEVLQMSGDTMVLAIGIAEEGPHTNNVLLSLAVELHMLVAQYNILNQTTFSIGIGLSIGGILEFLCGTGKIDYQVVGDEITNVLELARNAPSDYINVSKDFLDFLHLDDAPTARASLEKHVMFSEKQGGIRTNFSFQRERLSVEHATECAKKLVRTGIVKFSLDHDQESRSIATPGVIQGGVHIVPRSKDTKKTKRKFGLWKRSTSNDSDFDI